MLPRTPNSPLLTSYQSPRFPAERFVSPRPAAAPNQKATGNTFEPDLDLFLRCVRGNGHVTPDIQGCRSTVDLRVGVSSPKPRTPYPAILSLTSHDQYFRPYILNPDPQPETLKP